MAASGREAVFARYRLDATLDALDAFYARP